MINEGLPEPQKQLMEIIFKKIYSLSRKQDEKDKEKTRSQWGLSVPVLLISPLRLNQNKEIATK